MKVYVAVNEDGTEVMSNQILFRANEALNQLIEEDKQYNMYQKECNGKWANTYSDGYFNVPKFNGVIVPKGTIERLTGLRIKWEDGARLL